MNTHDRSASPSEWSPETSALPSWLALYAKYGVSALIVGLPLMGLAFVTNPVPDPSFPWATLSDTFRLSYTQPRIEHWPVTYTVGIWLWILGFPALFFAGYQWLTDHSRFDRRMWLVILPVVAMFAWTTYCRFFWPKPAPATWNAPSYTVVCWLYCSTYDPVWNNLAYAVASLGVVAAGLGYLFPTRSKYALAAFGTLALPLGLPALYEAYHRHRDESTTPHATRG